jgi:hypothetical protein
MKKNRKIWAVACTLLFLFTSCKNEWLDAKPSKSLVDASSIADLRAVLDNSTLFNTGYQGLEELASDNHYVLLPVWESQSSNLQRAVYVWDEEIYSGVTSNPDWRSSYERIFVANIVLEGVKRIEKAKGKSLESNEIEGAALFFRAFNFFNLSQLFCEPLIFNDPEGNKKLGLPLKLSANVNEVIKRSSLRETYEHIISDLTKASELLPERTTNKTRPSRQATYSLLARLYLSIGDYVNANRYSSSSLNINASLIDYNLLNSSSNYPVPLMNDEVIFQSQLGIYTLIYGTSFNIDTTLIEMYHDEDLRKDIFYYSQNGDFKYKGSYNGGPAFFGGLATDEMYLIRAECQAREGNIKKALDDLNTVMRKRWKKEKFIPYENLSLKEALELILNERRKELVFRGLRWGDLRRLNNDPEIEPITPVRKLGDNTYHLEPNSLKYTLPIPPDEIALSGIEQNSR